MQVWATVVHGSAGLHDVTAAGGVTVVVPPDFVDTSIAWPMPALMEPPVAADTMSFETKPGGNDNWNTAGPVVAPGDGAAAAAAKAAAGMDETESEGNTLDIDAVAASVVAAAKKAVAVAECAAEGLEWPCHDVGSTIVANNGGYYYGDITNDGGI